MTADGLAAAVRRQTGLGRLLPLGGPADGSWLVERTALTVLRAAVDEVPGVRLRRLRIGPVSGADTEPPLAPGPPSALRPGPLCLQASFDAAATRPLPELADRLRATLWEAQQRRLGLTLHAVHLHVADLFEESEPTSGTSPGTSEPAIDGSDERPATATTGPLLTGGDSPAAASDPLTRAAAEAAEAVTGVAALTRALVPLGGSWHPVHLTRSEAGAEGAAPGSRVQVQVAVAAEHRAWDTAQAVRTAVAEALTGRAPGPLTVTVLVTEVRER